MLKTQLIISYTWGKAFKVSVEGQSEFAKKNAHQPFNVKFKIIPSMTCWHWEVIVYKTMKKFDNQSGVVWGLRKMELYWDDVELEKKPSGDRQYVVAHEFGHAIGNLVDEYQKWSNYFYDKPSMMSNGMYIRQRHFDYILSELNSMIPNTQFCL